jgi:lipopolysaccharide export LptBFGC system permease protein LptF
VIKNKILGYILFIVIVIVFFNLFDFVYSEFITKNGYQFTAAGDIVLPTLVAVIIGYLLFLRKKD